MMDINFILNGKRKKKQPKKKSYLSSLMPSTQKTKSGLSGLMISTPKTKLKPLIPKESPRKKPNLASLMTTKIGPGRETKAQRKVKSKDFFGDWDKDGVINRLDCAPRNKKKHYWDLSRAKQERQYVTYMTPHEYLDKTDGLQKHEGERGVPYPWLEHYTDNEDGKMHPIKKLGQHIQGSTPVEIPFLEPSGDHEGRHRANAAMKMGHSVIPVAVFRPKEQVSQDVADKFSEKRFGNRKFGYEREKQSWRSRFEKGDPVPQMDMKSREKYYDTLREEGMEPEGPATREYPIREKKRYYHGTSEESLAKMGTQGGLKPQGGKTYLSDNPAYARLKAQQKTENTNFKPAVIVVETDEEFKREGRHYVTDKPIPMKQFKKVHTGDMKHIRQEEMDPAQEVEDTIKNET